MAEGFFRMYLSDAGRHESASLVKSAGLQPHGLNARAVEVMAEIGIDISAQTSNHLEEYSGQEFDYVITVCDNAAANCPTFPGKAKRIHWSFDDPATVTGTENEILKEFRRVRDEINKQIKSWLKQTLKDQ
jgi:arsenate reductase